jgi:hypothetical protein
MSKYIIKPNPDYEEHPVSANCLECGWSGLARDCDVEYERDEFWGCDRPYPICPECAAGVDVH